jgi:hypothetical protein
MRASLWLVGFGIVVSAAMTGCGGGSVKSAEICDQASVLLPQIADMDNETKGAHLGDWHDVLDLTMRAEDSGLAKYAKQVNETERQSLAYYSSLKDIQEMACATN